MSDSGARFAGTPPKARSHTMDRRLAGTVQLFLVIMVLLVIFGH